MEHILQIIVVLALFFIIKWGTWFYTERSGYRIPFLDYKPYICRKCLGFWLLASTYLAIGLSLHLYTLMIVGLMLTTLDTIALIVDEKANTITLEEYDKLIKNEDYE